MPFPSDVVDSELAHVAIFPSAGMGHLTPCLRLAALLLRHRHCTVTLITAEPTVSLAESRLISRFISSFPHRLSHLQFHLPLDPSTLATSGDAFGLHFDATRRSSANLLAPLLSSLSPPLSALVSDASLISPAVSLADSLSLPCYTLFTTSARMLSFFAYYPNLDESSFVADTALKIPGLTSPIPTSSIPTPLLNPTGHFANVFKTDAPNLRRLNGVFVNTFEGLELTKEPYLSVPLFAIGPLPPCEFESEASSDSAVLEWLDEQPEGSVVYVCFGSRTALPKQQTREVARGLIKSQCRFLWVVKQKEVDKKEEEAEEEEVVGREFMERLREKGLVVKTWVDQNEMLRHKAVGGFVSHCGWNSVVESAWHGVRVLAWPQHWDQKINAEVVRDSGLGMWVENWGWIGGGHDGDQTVVVRGEEIGERISEMMRSETLRVRAASIGEKAKKLGQVGGTRDKVFSQLVDEWRKNKSAK